MSGGETVVAILIIIACWQGCSFWREYLKHKSRMKEIDYMAKKRILTAEEAHRQTTQMLGEW